jgi:hypothetical protein
MHTLGVKLGLPTSAIVPVTTADLTNNVLRTGGFTAFINPGFSMAVGTTAAPTPAGTNLTAWVQAGGTYIGTSNGSSTAATGGNVAPVTAIRNTGLTTANTTTIPNLLTPGSTFDAMFDTSSPVAWGFDLGGWVYRDSSANPVYDKTTLTANNADAKSVVTFANTPDEKYGYEVNAAALGGQPAVIEDPFGTGRVVLFGFDPFFRSWKEQDERLVLNAALYPAGAALAAAPASEKTAQAAPTAGEIAPASVAPAKVAAKVAATKQSKVSDRDVRIQVKRKDAAKLKQAVKRTKLSKAIRKKISYKTTKTTVTLVIKGVRTSNEHAREQWVGELRHQLDRRKVKPIYALL